MMDLSKAYTKCTDCDHCGEIACCYVYNMDLEILFTEYQVYNFGVGYICHFCYDSNE